MEKEKIKRTAAQEAAVSCRGRNLMISAAAGSGKTATLTQRILSLLTDPDRPADISSMLIVTFTRKAAGELRQRITEAIHASLAEQPDNTHLAHQLISVGAADICTIDAYYLKLVRENFQKLNLPSSFRMADPAETAILARETAEKTVERRFASDSAFPHLADTLTSARAEGELAGLLIGLSVRAASLPDGAESLAKSGEQFIREADAPFFSGRTGKLAKAILTASLRDAGAALLSDIDRISGEEGLLPYLPAFENDAAAIGGILELLIADAPYRDVRAAVMAYAPLGLGRMKKDADKQTAQDVKDDRDDIKALLSSLQKDWFALTEEELRDSLRETGNLLLEAAAVVGEYEEAFRDAKNRRQIADFSDLGRYAVRLLTNEDGTPSDVARAEQEKYSHIFVDEYQDTDSRQDRIFRLISRGNNLFLVGDIKQSIYSFRGAQPSVFAAYRNRWKPLGEAAPGEPAAIYMSENFRCSRAVIDFTNLVCGRLFSEAEENASLTGGIGYRREDDLIYAGKSPTVGPVEIVAAEGTEAREGEDLPLEEKNGQLAEIRYTVDKIREIAARRGHPERGEYAWKDIAVLARSGSALKRVAAALTAEGIPFSNNDDRGLFENPEVLMFLSVMSAIDNPMRDTQLAGALRSPVFGFSPDDLVRIRLSRKNMSLWEAVKDYSSAADAEESLGRRCADAVSRLTAYRKLSEETPVDRFIRTLWRETGASGYAGSDPLTRRQKPAERQSNLRRLYEFARTYQSSGYRTLHDFVSYLSGIVAGETVIDIATSPAADAVSLMTVHKSKGLEFPAVILTGTTGEFNLTEYRASNVFTDFSDIGLVSKQTDPTGLCIQDCPARLAVSGLREALAREEEIRILYVALTRAREELYITGHGKAGFLDKRLDEAQKDRGTGRTVSRRGDWFSWILSALSGLDPENPDGFFRLRRVTGTISDSGAAATDVAGNPERATHSGQNENRDEDFARRQKAAYERMRDAVAYGYPYAAESRIPAKLSVSQLYPDLISDAEEEETAHLILPEPEEKIPRFLREQADAAARGTATHVFLQFCDFSALDGTREATERELDRLILRQFLPEKTARLVRTGEIDRFARSDLFRQIRNAKTVEREKRFNILLPAAYFTRDESLRDRLRNETVLVQGVIDLFFETNDGEILLCDYKTDRIPEEIRQGGAEAVADLMRKRHGAQLGYYAEAVRQICGRAPGRILVFPLAFGEAVKIQ